MSHYDEERQRILDKLATLRIEDNEWSVYVGGVDVPPLRIDEDDDGEITIVFADTAVLDTVTEIEIEDGDDANVEMMTNAESLDVMSLEYDDTTVDVVVSRYPISAAQIEITNELSELQETKGTYDPDES